MSDAIHHECGITMLRLRKPLDFYNQKYGTPFYGIQKLQLLMQKMRNRGQDGAGLATIKLDTQPGRRYISRKRSNATNYLDDLFNMVWARIAEVPTDKFGDTTWLKNNAAYAGEVLMGHLRYGTHGDNSIERVHPFHRQNNWISRNLLLAGNFNLTNVDELFAELVELGQYPKEKSDTVTVLEKIGHFLDDEIQRLFNWYKPDAKDHDELNALMFEHLDIQRLLMRACKKFDGGYVFGGMIGHGDAFMVRDPHGIRPAYWYMDDEVIVAASERPAIQTVFNVRFPNVHEIKPGHALIMKHNGIVEEKPYFENIPERASCSFERIYFSRGNDREIYQERKQLGAQLAVPALESVGYDINHTVFSYIPNTAEAAFYGLAEGLERATNDWKQKELLAASSAGELTPEKITEILNVHPRVEKLVHKDEKQRTFIADHNKRSNMVLYVYDVTYGLIENDVDALVMLDDSIVRGTTLRESIVSITARLNPRKIVVLSSAPQIRYPDCYGIDMSRMKDFVAFQAMVALLKEAKKEHLLQEVYERCKASEQVPVEEVKNEVIALYDLFDYKAVSKKISEIVTPDGIKADVEVIFQPLEGLHAACTKNSGDWYFSGKYPTPGGNRVANRAFINYIDNNDARAY